MSGGEGCQFCLSYGESEEHSRTHRLRTASGLVSCPVLRSLVCPICQATGDFAHTKSYCPLVSMDAVSEEANSNMMKTKTTTGKVPRMSQSGPRPWPIPSYQKMMNNYTGTIRHPPPVFHHQEPTSPLLAKHQKYLDYYRKKWMEHQAEVNRLQALRKLQSQVSQPPPSLNTLYYRTFKAPAKTPEAKHQQHFFPDSMQVGAAMMDMDNSELDIELAKLREGTVEVKMY